MAKGAGDGGRNTRRQKILRQMADLREIKPLSLARTFGSNGPTPTQRANYDQRVRDWNRQYRALNKQQKDLA
jgi:hypothetical protein